jgi:hypothetical protein
MPQGKKRDLTRQTSCDTVLGFYLKDHPIYSRLLQTARVLTSLFIEKWQVRVFFVPWLLYVKKDNAYTCATVSVFHHLEVRITGLWNMTLNRMTRRCAGQMFAR